MKLNRLFLLAMIAVCSLTALAINPEYERYLKNCPRNAQGNFDPHNMKSISVRFNGTEIDTLTLFPLSGERDFDGFYYNKWIIVSRNATVPSVVVESYWPELIAEGDLDGNGCDEFAISETGRHGCWLSYIVYTCHRSKLHEMISTIWYACDDQPLESIVSPGSQKGIVNVSHYDMHEVGEGSILRHDTTKRITKFLK